MNYLTNIELKNDTPSILQGIVLNETIDLNLLNQLINSNLLQTVYLLIKKDILYY
jgi:hypothetical protein